MLFDDMTESLAQFDGAAGPYIATCFGRSEDQNLTADSLPDSVEATISDLFGKFGQAELWVETPHDDLEQSHSGFLSYQAKKQVSLILRIESPRAISSSVRIENGVGQLGKMCTDCKRRTADETPSQRYSQFCPIEPSCLIPLTPTMGFPNLTNVGRRAQVA